MSTMVYVVLRCWWSGVAYNVHASTNNREAMNCWQSLTGADFVIIEVWKDGVKIEEYIRFLR